MKIQKYISIPSINKKIKQSYAEVVNKVTLLKPNEQWSSYYNYQLSYHCKQIEPMMFKEYRENLSRRI